MCHTQPVCSYSRSPDIIINTCTDWEHCWCNAHAHLRPNSLPWTGCKFSNLQATPLYKLDCWSECSKSNFYVAFFVAAFAAGIWSASVGNLVTVASAMLRTCTAHENATVCFKNFDRSCIIHTYNLFDVCAVHPPSCTVDPRCTPSSQFPGACSGSSSKHVGQKQRIRELEFKTLHHGISTYLREGFIWNLVWWHQQLQRRKCRVAIHSGHLTESYVAASNRLRQTEKCKA